MLYFDPPEDWQLIVDYALNGGPKPSYERAQKIFKQEKENRHSIYPRRNRKVQGRSFQRPIILQKKSLLTKWKKAI